MLNRGRSGPVSTDSRSCLQLDKMAEDGEVSALVCDNGSGMVKVRVPTPATRAAVGGRESCDQKREVVHIRRFLFPSARSCSVCLRFCWSRAGVPRSARRLQPDTVSR
jgi:hypothetical protein